MELQGKTLCVLGDSITAGIGVSDPDRVFWRILEKKGGFDQAFGYGVSCTRIARQIVETEPIEADSHFCCRYLQMQKDADVVLVFGGTNDYGHGDAPFGCMEDRTEDTFFGACHCLMNGLIDRYPDAVIVIATPLHRADENKCNPHTGRSLEDYVCAIRQVAAYYSLPLIDLYAMSGIQPIHPVCRERLCPDGIHPNEKGHLLLASRIAGFLTTL